MTKKIFFHIFSVALTSVLLIGIFGYLGYRYSSFPLLIISACFGLVSAVGLSIAAALSLSGRLKQVEEGVRCMNEGNYLPIELSKIDETDPLYSITKELIDLNKSINKRIISEKNEKTKLQEVLDNVSQGIIALSRSSDIVFVNNSALRMFSGTEDYVGKKPIFLIDDTVLVGKIISNNEEDSFFEYKIGDKELSFVTKIIVDKNLSKKISRIIIITDITRQKNMARQKSEFFANASHELKTPITVMQGLTEILLSKESLDEGTKKQLERIHKESLRMASLIADMLKLSKLERNEENEELTELSLKQVVEEIIGELSTQMTQKNISWEIKGQCSVLANSKKIFELVGNLLSNAVNYNKENGHIEVLLSEDEENSILKVKDTGIGIEREHLPRLCERFYRVDKSRSKKTGGTGLGLAIVKHICALYKAELKIESEINVGTEVSVIFKK